VSGRSASCPVGGFAVPESVFWAYGTTEVVPSHEHEITRIVG